MGETERDGGKHSFFSLELTRMIHEEEHFALLGYDSCNICLDDLDIRELSSMSGEAYSIPIILVAYLALFFNVSFPGLFECRSPASGASCSQDQGQGFLMKRLLESMDEAFWTTGGASDSKIRKLDGGGVARDDCS